MIKLENEEYDLNFLFSLNIDFKMLKEVLFKLAKRQTNLETEIKSLKASNLKQDKKISKLQKQLKSPINYDKYKEDGNEIPIDEINKDIEINQNEIEKNIEENNIEKEIEEEQNNNKTHKKLSSIDIRPKKFQDMGIEPIDEEKKIHPFSDRNKEQKNQPLNVSQITSFSGVNSEVINNILSSIQNLSNKIKNLNNKLIYKIRDEVFPIKKQINNLSSQNTEEHRLMNEQLNELNKKQIDLAEKVEDCLVKCQNFDLLSAFKDNGDGTVDTAKTLFKALEAKVFKKFELMEARNKEEVAKNFKKNLLLDNLKPIVEKLNQEVPDLKTDLIKNKNETHDLIKELDNIFKANIDLMSKKLKDLNLKVNNCLTNSLTTEDRIKDILNNMDLTNSNKEDMGDFEIGDKKIIDKLNRKILDLYNKVRDIDVLLKTTVNNHGQELNDINESLTEMKDNYYKKINKDDLKELYNFYYDHVNQLKRINDKVSDLTELDQKINDDYSSIFKKIETLSRDVIELKNKELSDNLNKPIDMSKYIDDYKFKDLMKPYKKEIENLIRETDSLNSQFSSTKEDMELLATRDYVNKLDDEVNDKINDLLNKISKKYIEKIFFEKTMKNVDIQLKLISDNSNNKESDSWILAKNPISCFNCASCEANIKNLSPKNEYLPWGKFPQVEKQYRIGQGFSKLLKKVNTGSDFNLVKNSEKKEFLGEDLFYNSMSNNLGFKKNIMGKFSNKEGDKDDSFKNSPRNYKLPNVIMNNRSKKDIPLTDEEKERSEGSIVTKVNNDKSPKILKITRKTGTMKTGQIYINGPSNLKENNDNDRSTVKMSTTTEKHKLTRVQSLPLYN